MVNYKVLIVRKTKIPVSQGRKGFPNIWLFRKCLMWSFILSATIFVTAKLGFITQCLADPAVKVRI